MLINLLCTTIFGFSLCSTPAPGECFVDPESGLEVCLQPVEPVQPEISA